MRKVGAVMATASLKQKLVDTAQRVPESQPLDSPASFARFADVTAQCVRNWTREPGFPLVIHAGRIIRFERQAALDYLKGKGAAQ
jgi:hypothetical protein